MKTIINFFITTLAILALFSVVVPSASASQYGIYGVVDYAGANNPPQHVVQGPLVTIWKEDGGTYYYHGETYASACGYFTYDTGERGNFKATVNGNYFIRDISDCGYTGTQVSFWSQGFGTVTYLAPQVEINMIGS